MGEELVANSLFFFFCLWGFVEGVGIQLGTGWRLVPVGPKLTVSEF